MILPPRPWPISRHPAFDVAEAEWAAVATYFNPSGYRRPAQNLGAFLDWCYAERIPLWMGELSFHDAHPILPAHHPRVLQFRAGEAGVMFQKEALLNAVAATLPHHIKAIAFFDADVVLERGMAALDEAAAALADEPMLVQPFSDAVWTDAAGRPGPPKPGTGWAWDHAQERMQVADPVVYHPGFVTVMRSETWHAIGGLHGCPITGTGDAALWQAALAPHLPPPILGRSHYTAPAPQAWRAKVAASLGVRVAGYVPGRIIHLHHGSMGRRAYDARHKLLSQFRPDRHLCVDPWGLPSWTPQAAHLQTAMRAYFDSRQEDE